MRLTDTQPMQARKMNDEGITWSIIETYFKAKTNTLRKQLKDYETTQSTPGFSLTPHVYREKGGLPVIGKTSS